MKVIKKGASIQRFSIVILFGLGGQGHFGLDKTVGSPEPFAHVILNVPKPADGKASM
jgi:hypothetical protein